MTAIYRYPLKAFGETEIDCPIGASVVDAVFSPERDEFSVYMQIDPTEKMTTRRKFRKLATGMPLEIHSSLVRHCRSLIMPDGFHVFHVVEVLR